MCNMHYLRWWRTGSTADTRISYEGVICSVDGCSEPAKAHSLCNRHNARMWKYGRIEPVGRKAKELAGSQWNILDEYSAEIILTRGYVAIIDLEDLEDVKQYNWHAVVDNEGKRVRAQGYVDGVVMYLHRFIMGRKESLEIDHADDDPLNCRKANLSFLTHQQNCYYRNPLLKESAQ